MAPVMVQAEARVWRTVGLMRDSGGRGEAFGANFREPPAVTPAPWGAHPPQHPQMPSARNHPPDSLALSARFTAPLQMATTCPGGAWGLWQEGVGASPKTTLQGGWVPARAR